MSRPTATPAQTPAYSVAPPSARLIQIRDLLYRVAGLFQPDSRLRFLESECWKRMHVLGVTTLRDYYQCLTRMPTCEAELTALLNEITIGETCFFRNQPQLAALHSVVFPRIFEAKCKTSNRHLRIWSAGCSTGEEAYTLSMMLREELDAQPKEWTFEIMATDLNQRSIVHAEQGLYGPYSTRNISEYFRQKYFVSCGSNLQINAEVKSFVKFSRLNFLDDANMVLLANLDLIFCCNVLIYFHGAAKRRVVQHFYDNLLPHGYLFLGQSESLYGLNEDFRLVHMSFATAYVKPAPTPVST